MTEERNEKILEKLYDLDVQIRRVEDELQEAKEKHEEAKEVLEKEYGCKTIAQIEKKLEKLENERDKTSAELEKLLDEIEEELYDDE